ncbi:CHAP domain-containing protein [Streptomyces sp. NPDC089919]|uniref:CHAP domain-containing protein n=1 Tax=Streptomyces sp. NPDC089919 TaxID=3155188 RepID=UPI0034416C63
MTARRAAGIRTGTRGRTATRLRTAVLAALAAGPLLASLAVAPARADAPSVAAIARAQVGGSCGDYACQNPGAWCAEFIRWVWNRAGADVSGITPAAISLYDYGRNKGTVHGTPQVGDAVLYDKDGTLGDREADHANIVVSVSGDYIETVGGNESNGVRFRESFNWRTSSSPVGAGRALAFVGPAGLSETPSVPVSTAGDLFHAIRAADGTWTSFQPLNGFGGAPFFNARQQSLAATPDGSTQSLAIGNDGDLYTTARYPDGSWTAWVPLAGAAGAPHFAAKGQAIAGMSNGDAQVVALGTDGRIQHNTRLVTGVWTGWTQVGTWQAQKVAAAGLPDGSLQVLIVGNDGNLYHSVRRPDGTWQSWHAVAGTGQAATFQAKEIAIAALPNGDAQVVAVGADGRVQHTIRFADGSWQGWGALDGFGGASSFAASAVAVTGMPNGDAQLLAVGNDGKAYHDIRYANGQWQGWRATGAGARQVALAGTPGGAAQMLITRS